jgi:phosphoglycerate dehydrogenase-like enzyme
MVEACRERRVPGHDGHSDEHERTMMHRTAILDDYVGDALDLADWSEMQGLAPVTAFKSHLPEGRAADELKEFSILVLMRERMALPRALIEQLPNLRFVVFSGATNTVIDMAALRERGVVVSRTNVPQAGPARHVPSAAAEMTWALLMAAARRLPQEDATIRAGGWNASNGMRLYGRTLGVVGFGEIGRTVAGYAAAFGMKVLAWSQNLQPQDVGGTSAACAGKADQFEKSDFISLHYRLGDRSVGLFGQDELARMKRSAILINTARGPLVDEDALVAALREGRVAGAALDVFATEPLSTDHPLRTLPNVILSPHVGYATYDFMRASYQRSAQSVLAFLRGQPINLVSDDAAEQ